MSLFADFSITSIHVLTTLFVFAAAVVFLIVAVMFVIDVSQTADAVRRNYPVIGRFRRLFTTLGEYFRQYFFAMDRDEMPFTREEIYVQWLAQRLAQDGAAQLEEEDTRLVSFQRLRSFRKQRSRYVEGPDAVLRGVLTLGDPAAFGSLLSRGVGRHRSYGYGMLLLRPAGGRLTAE